MSKSDIFLYHIDNIARGINVLTSAKELGKLYYQYNDEIQSNLYYEIASLSKNAMNLWVDVHYHRYLTRNKSEIIRCYNIIIENDGKDAGVAAYELATYYDKQLYELLSAVPYYCKAAEKNNNAGKEIVDKLFKNYVMGRYAEINCELIMIMAAYFRNDVKEYDRMAKCYLKIVYNSEDDVAIIEAAYAYGNYCENIEYNYPMAMKMYAIGLSKNDKASKRAFLVLGAKIDKLH